ncbi:Relaxase/Mobilisation nuclease domain-containing protein [Sphingobium sp. AP50]|uniref:relaxase/mobilization nuclease domain-containing protein n=1 Tax=Sphingobium sp. AP50 TaxID=1884369 RepID=UPI0008AD50F0|nr:relaxase/mobilization nuclease domain-containing protein [Sphingobium sp. AP50]SEJ80752.1 Relaxase/Mobilisation nuclease domain-containing protein [Sphingobium sp. AP50]
MSEEDDILPLPSLMEAWRPPSGGKRVLKGGTVRIRTGRGGGQARPAMSQAEARAKLERIVRKAPEVMVKVSGKQRSTQHLAEHFGYVSRHGKLEVRSSEGEIITDEKRLKAIAFDWAMLDEATNIYGRDRPISTSMILSMPGGTAEADTILDAVQAFARIEFKGRFSYMVALHTDTDHPHVHVTVANQGEDGSRFNPRKADLHHMRETFALELRARGIAAEATPRRARGHVQKRVRSAAKHLEARTAAEGRGLDIHRLVEERAAEFAQSQEPERREQDRAALHRQKFIRGAYAEAATALAGTGREEDAALADEITQFVADMPPAVSRRLQRAREIMMADRASGSADRTEPSNEPPTDPRDRGVPPPPDRER